MDIPLLTLWFVCGLGAAVFAAADPTDAGAPTRWWWTHGVAAAAAFALCAWWIRQPFAPSAAAVALTVAVAAAARVTRTPRRAYGRITAGALAGVWSGLLEYQGLPLGLSIAGAALVPAIAAAFHAMRPTFAPSRMREEALLVLVLLGIVAAALPGITDGWQAAVNLTVQSGSAPADIAAPAMPRWTLAVATCALVSGGLFSLWSRR